MEKLIRVAIIDDEQGCIDNMAYHLRQDCPRLQVVATAFDAGSAACVLNRPDVDAAFLDIHLFDQNIFDVLPQLSPRALPLVFVSAYNQYALQAFQTAVVDYLLKPLDHQDVQRSYAKILRHLDGRQAPPAAPHAKSLCHGLQLRQGDCLYNVPAEEIVLLKARGFYTEVCFVHRGAVRTVVTSKPLNAVLERFHDVDAIQRIHRSYAINTSRILSIRQQGRSAYVELDGAGKVPIAKRRAAEFISHCRV